jgi:hypothetical protein
MWLAGRPYWSWPFCLTFVRESDERHVFQAFGANPDDAVPARTNASLSGAHRIPVVRVGRSGEWLFALEENIPPQGTRPEVLRRVSAGTEAVAIYHDIGKLNHEFAHALNEELITAVTTSVPPHWQGSDPDRLRTLTEELGLSGDGDTGFSDLEVLLALAEGVFGLSLDEADLRRSWPAAPIQTIPDDVRVSRDRGASPERK